MSTHQLNILENAIDSLAESLSKFEEGDSGEPNAYKFAVLHMAHFVELTFKYYVSQKHPLLVYQKPFDKKLNKDRTIGLWEAINFINNEAANAETERTISDELRKDLEWLKRLRNEIEHHKFTMDVQQTRVTIGRLFRSVLEFLNEYTDVSIEDKIPSTLIEPFRVLSDEYEFQRRDAINRAEEIEQEGRAGDPSDPGSIPDRLVCEECDSPTMIIDDSSPTGYKCLFCGNLEGDEIPVWCSACGAISTRGDVDFWETDDGESEVRCYYCSGRYHADKDD